ncbi:glycosyltransferase [Lamprobacter modestohalophilus]|uniref:glycosyltransferase n=1 Tax=Lamprobacter modestohalophilus TaxID=1064514 RepID=UPI002ADEC6BA|nr:glycosyltransferase [Lamprobacter modestohalophilus]MEA1050966.1 glycosyltransferase [Lamprobacter modestohalophilus]
MQLTIVVSTHNRANALQRSLDTLNRINTDVDWELIIVNNASTDNTAAVLQSFASKTTHKVRLLYEPRLGLSCARNAGLSAARGEIVAFTDDDCYPQSDYASIVIQRFADPEVAFVGGRVLLYDPTDLRMTIQELDREVVIKPYSYIAPGMIHGANMAFRRSILLDLAGFDERLGAGSPFKAAEDTDAVIRCSKAGFGGFYDPALIVKHHHGRKSPDDARALKKNYAIGRGACFMKHCLDITSRSHYMRRWYWHLRLIPYSTRNLELWTGLRFMMRYGVIPSKVYQHPHNCLNMIDIGCVD